jgi:hypothetical protein
MSPAEVLRRMAARRKPKGIHARLTMPPNPFFTL